jgi:hypothetical protein
MSAIDALKLAWEFFEKAPLDIGNLHRVTLLFGKICLYFLVAYCYLEILEKIKISLNPSFALILLAFLPLMMTLDMKEKKKHEKELGENFNIKFLKGVNHKNINTPHDFLQELFSKKLDEATKVTLNSLSIKKICLLLLPVVSINYVVFPSLVLEFILQPFSQQFNGFVNGFLIFLIFLLLFIAVWFQFYLLVENLARNGKNHSSENTNEANSKSLNETVKSWLVSMILFILSLENPYGEYIFGAYFGRKTKRSILFFTFLLTFFSIFFLQPWATFMSKKKETEYDLKPRFLVFKLNLGKSVAECSIAKKIIPQCKAIVYKDKNQKDRRESESKVIDHLLERCTDVFKKRLMLQEFEAENFNGFVWVPEFKDQKHRITDKEGCLDLFTDYIESVNASLGSLSVEGDILNEDFETLTKYINPDTIKGLFEDPIVMGLGADTSTEVTMKTIKSSLKAAECLSDKDPLNKFLLYLPIIFILKRNVMIRTSYKATGGSNVKYKIESFDAYFSIPVLVMVGFFSTSEWLQIQNMLVQEHSDNPKKDGNPPPKRGGVFDPSAVCRGGPNLFCLNPLVPYWYSNVLLFQLKYRFRLM